VTFTTLSEFEERELYRLSRFYWNEALRCEESKAYLAGSIMLGSALETILMLMVNCYPEEASATGKIPRSRGQERALTDWSLNQLLEIAKKAGWLPSALELGDDWNSRKARIGDHAEVTRMIRNLVHPGNYLKQHSRSRVTKKYLQRQFDVVLLCRDWLGERNNRSLREHMREDGLL
jgi:hypothetical protein